MCSNGLSGSLKCGMGRKGSDILGWAGGNWSQWFGWKFQDRNSAHFSERHCGMTTHIGQIALQKRKTTLKSLLFGGYPPTPHPYRKFPVRGFFSTDETANFWLEIKKET